MKGIERAPDPPLEEGRADKPRLLVVEDDGAVKTQMKWALGADYDVLTSADGEHAIVTFTEERPDLVILDLGLPPHQGDVSEGLRLLDRFLQIDAAVKVIVVTGNPEKSAALQAISRGAYDFFTKPIDLTELKYILKRAYYVNTLEAEYRELQRQLSGPCFAEMIGSCQRMRKIFTTVRKVAATEVPVLITGESGTGKELIARAIHSNGARSAGPFVPINCGAIPGNLLESELFGHEKGAFTGAHAQRYGRIEKAHKGTLFLDEIGELPPTLQVKMLRFLQDHTIERVGGQDSIELDIRVVAATNCDISRSIAEGRFREDLYYRLAVVNIDLPPLRERGEDIVLLAREFLNRFSPDCSKTLSDDAIGAVNSYPWPGNVRELENKIRRALTFSEGPSITEEDLSLERSAPLNLKKAVEAMEIRFVKAAISKHNGNISRAAEELGLSRPTLHHMIKRYNIERIK